MSDDIWRQVPEDPATMAMIGELKRKGYMVVHRDAVQTVGASRTMDKDHLLRLDIPAARIIREGLANSLAHHLLQGPYLPILETERHVTRITYETRVTILGARIGPDHPDYPLYIVP